MCFLCAYPSLILSSTCRLNRKHIAYFNTDRALACQHSSSHKHPFYPRCVLVKISFAWVIPWLSAICWKAWWQSERKVHIYHSGANWILVNKDNLWALKLIRTVSVDFVDRTWFIGLVYFWLTHSAQIYWGLMTKMPNTPLFMRNQWGLLSLSFLIKTGFCI